MDELKQQNASGKGRPDDAPGGDAGVSRSERGLFARPEPERSAGAPATIWVAAGLIVLLLVAAFLLFGRQRAVRNPNAIVPLAAKASSVVLSQLQMSESTSLSGGKSTYIDGDLTNAGQETLTGVTVQVLFHNDEALPPQVVTLPLTLVRTRQPYVDTEPISVEPLSQGTHHEFRLIFESVAPNWNQQMPEIHVVGVNAR